MEKINLLFLNYSLEIGGIETMIIDFIDFLPKERFNPAVAIFSSGGMLEKKLTESNTDIYRLNKREGIDWAIIQKIRHLVKEHRIHVIHSNNYSSWFYGLLAIFGLRGVKLVHTEHSNVKPLRRRYLMERFLALFTDQIVAVSEQVRSILVKDIGVNKSRVGMINNGVNQSLFQASHEKRLQSRKGLGIDQNSFVVGIVARLVPVKDHVTLIRAFKKVIEIIPQAILLLVGDGSLRPELEEMIREKKIEESVVLVGARRDIPELLNAMDLYVLSSKDEGMNLTVLEAMSCSLPVVATNIGGNPEIVKNDKTGFLVDSENPTLLAESIIKLGLDPDLRDAMGKEGRASVVECFSQEVTIEAYMKLYIQFSPYGVANK